MIRYPALIDGDAGAYGVVFPDIPGVGAMGHTVDEAIMNAMAVLVDYAIETERDGEELAPPSPCESIETPEGNRRVLVMLIRPSGEGIRVGLKLEEGIAEFV